MIFNQRNNTTANRTPIPKKYDVESKLKKKKKKADTKTPRKKIPSIQVQSWKRHRLQIGLNGRKCRARRRGKRVINSSFVVEGPAGNAYKVEPNARNRNHGRGRKKRGREKLRSLFISVFVFPKVVFASCNATQVESRTFDSSRFVIGYVILWHAILSRFEIASSRSRVEKC